MGHYKDGFLDRFTETLEGDVGHVIYHKYIDEKFLDCEPEKIANSALSWDGFYVANNL